jgi:hypothetical protein
VAATHDRDQIRIALTQNDPAISCYLDLETGTVVHIDERDSSPDTEQLRNQIMDGYGDRYRYIPGGKAGADAGDVSSWLEAEGL